MSTRLPTENEAFVMARAIAESGASTSDKGLLNDVRVFFCGLSMIALSTPLEFINFILKLVECNDNVDDFSACDFRSFDIDLP
jgi:hypothetical protein